MEHSFLNFTFFSEDIDTYFRRLLLGYISLTGKLFLPKKINNFNEFCYIKLIVFLGDSITLLNLVPLPCKH